MRAFLDWSSMTAVPVASFIYLPSDVRLELNISNMTSMPTLRCLILCPALTVLGMAKSSLWSAYKSSSKFCRVDFDDVGVYGRPSSQHNTT